MNAVNVGTFFTVHLNIHELAVHDCSHFFIFERFVRHHVAPVAGGITYREKDGFVFLARFGKRVLTPGVPIDRIMRVLKKVGRLLVREPVSVLEFFCSARRCQVSTAMICCHQPR